MNADLENENRKLKSQIETYKELLAVTEEVVSFKTEELRQSNEKLNETYDYVAAIIDNMADGLLVIDTEDVITRVNPALNRLFRKEKEELTDCHILTGCHIEELDIPALSDLVQQSRAVEEKEAVSIELDMPGKRFRGCMKKRSVISAIIIQPASRSTHSINPTVRKQLKRSMKRSKSWWKRPMNVL